MSATRPDTGAVASICARVGWIFTLGTSCGVYALVARMTAPASHESSPATTSTPLRRDTGEQEARVAPARAPREVVSLEEHGVDPAAQEVPQQACPRDASPDHQDVGLLGQAAWVFLRRW